MIGTSRKQQTPRFAAVFARVRSGHWQDLSTHANPAIGGVFLELRRCAATV